MGQFWSETFAPQSHFVPSRDIPDLSDKVVIVTGGNTGIGKGTVRELLRKNAKVYLAARSKTRAEQAIAELKIETGKEAIFLELNLANLSLVTRAADEFKSKEAALHILFNSAAVMKPPIESMTDDGYDLQWGTNLLGHAHFTLELMPALMAGAKSSPDGKARVVNTSSSAAYFFPKIEWESLKGDNPERKKLGSQVLYCQSKFGNAVFSNELARRYADQGIISNALNPGNIVSELDRNVTLIFHILTYWMKYPESYGPLTQLWVGTSPEAKDYNGAWFIPWARPGEINKEAKDPELGTKLWDWIEQERKNHA